jgi:methylated-DNA-protein-cysteine methyltransferase-like protein
VAALVRRVPHGALTTYGAVASALGAPRAAREVGWALAALPAHTDVPWQRVINAQGRISGRGELGRAALQRALLESEGISFDADDRCDLDALRYPFKVEDLSELPGA